MEASTLEVKAFAADHLVNIIRRTTGADIRGMIAGRQQIDYLSKYLGDNKARTLVVETEYIDRYFLEDHNEYYSSCFNDFPRKCSRVHFFTAEFGYKELSSKLAKNDQEFVGTLQSTYLGFVVIRPVEETFLCRVCFKPYRKFFDNPEAHRLIQQRYEVNLAGVELTVHSVALQEQDKVVAACATSAIWSFLNANGHISAQQLPSLSQITKVAAPLGFGQMRTFPNQGLDRDQIGSSLKSFGLEPMVIQRDFGDPLDWMSTIQDNLYAYLDGSIPVMLGGALYCETIDDGKKSYEKLGDHIVTIVGFSAQGDMPEGTKLRNRQLDKVYVHDDRFGPFALGTLTYLDLDDVEPAYDADEQSVGQGAQAASAAASPTIKIPCIRLTPPRHPGAPAEYLLPDIIQFGLYHKVRMHFTEAHDLSDALMTYLRAVLAHFPDSRFDLLNSATFSISLKTVQQLKSELMEQQGECLSNWGSKQDLLFSNLPRFIWRFRIHGEHEPLTDFFFDATEAPQGSRVIGWATYTTDLYHAWLNIFESLNANDSGFLLYKPGALGTVLKAIPYLSQFLKFATRTERSPLNSFIGRASLPDRPLKEGEEDGFQNVVKRHDLLRISLESGPTAGVSLKKGVKYIWVIDADGVMIIGEDKGGDSWSQGHPTLVDYREARIGGELIWEPKTRIWGINNYSGCYPTDVEDIGSILEVVIGHYLSRIPDEAFEVRVASADAHQAAASGT